MSLGRARAVALFGLEGCVCDVEAQVGVGLPVFRIVGLPDSALLEARERVRSALQSSGLNLPNRRVTVNLSPANMPKAGSGFDVALAVAVVAAGTLPGRERAAARVHIGELGLDGRVHPVRGVLPMVALAVAQGHRDIVVPQANLDEARLVPGARVAGIWHLAELLQQYGLSVAAHLDIPPALPPAAAAEPHRGGDMADIVGQEGARYALEVAAAGGHHLYLNGPPGAGKTMLASRLPGILPRLSDEEAVTVTSIHSLSGTLAHCDRLLREPPFEAPHHTATQAAIVGGGSGVPRPGAISRAHCGVLFLDEAPEFATSVLQTLRQPLESGQVVVHRARGTACYPARFQLVLAANPCPCGLGRQCQCGGGARRRYLQKLSGPLLDRVDIQITVPRVQRLVGGRVEDSAAIARRVAQARQRQARRYRDLPWSLNAAAPGSYLRAAERAPRELGEIGKLVEKGALSMRGLDRVLRLSWTLADLDGLPAPGPLHLGIAQTLRTGEQHAASLV